MFIEKISSGFEHESNFFQPGNSERGWNLNDNHEDEWVDRNVQTEHNVAHLLCLTSIEKVLSGDFLSQRSAEKREKFGPFKAVCLPLPKWKLHEVGSDKGGREVCSGRVEAIEKHEEVKNKGLLRKEEQTSIRGSWHREHKFPVKCSLESKAGAEPVGVGDAVEGEGS